MLQKLSSNSDIALMEKIKMSFWNLRGIFCEDMETLKALQQQQELKNSSDLLECKVSPN